MLLVSGATTTLRPYILERPDVFGTLVVPRDGNALPEVGRWAADNGAFTGFEEIPFLAMLKRHSYAKDRCLFVACPDVVGHHRPTFELFQTWGRNLRAAGWPVAFIAQDGCRAGDVPFDDIEALFIGGTTTYKLSSEAARCVVAAHELGKWVHMGRVNTARRLHYAAVLGVDSVDGSGWSKWSKAMLAKHGRLLRDLSEQRRLVLQALGEEP